jgi:uncharacterized protein DUF29
MSNRPSGSEPGPIPFTEPARATYDSDFYSWALDQARLVREGRWEAIDRENVAEELDSWAWVQFDRLEGALRVLLLHMLKWDHQPERRDRSLTLSIKIQRINLEDALDGNLGLKSRLAEAIDHAYRLVRLDAAIETELDEDEFPEKCPYTWSDIAGRDFCL